MKNILAIVMAVAVALTLGFTVAQAKDLSNGITYFDRDSGSKIAPVGLDLVVANGITVTEPAPMIHEVSSAAAGGLREEKPEMDLYNGITVFK